MAQVRVALVCPDDALRMVAAKAFDEAPPEWDVHLHRTVPEGADVLVAVGCEVADSVTFDAAHPANVVDEVKRRLVTSRRRLIAVVGASGGCGATSVALHLAAEATNTTCVVASSDRLSHRLGLDPAALGDAAIPVPGGFKVVKATAPERAPDLLRDFENVIVDAGRAALQSAADACVLVLAPTLPSAGAAAELLRSFPERVWAVVTNRLGPGGETGSAELQRILGRRICLELPCSRALRDAEGECRLLPEWSLWRRRVRRLAHALELR